MTQRIAVPKPAQRMPEPPRPHQEAQVGIRPSRHEAARELRDESDCFAQLLGGLDNAGQGVVAKLCGDSNDNQQPSRQDPGPSGYPPIAKPQTRELWESLLARLEQHMGEFDQGPLEVKLELPSLGAVTVWLLPQGRELEIALQFAQKSAWQYCAAQRQASAAWLARQLGRPVRLTLQQERH